MKERPLLEGLTSGGKSPYRQYLDLFVGASSAWALLKYEVLASLFSVVPGAAGYFLRGKGYPKLLRKVGRSCMFGRNTILRCPGQISLGNGVVIDDYVVLDAKGAGSSIELGDQILVGRYGVLSCTEATLRIGSFVSMGPFCTIVTKSSIEIGSNVSIGGGSRLLGAGHAMDDPNAPPIRQRRVSKGIVIEDNVWLGADVKVLDGAIVRRNSIIGTGAVVRGEIPPDSVAAGVPAKVLYNRLERAAQQATAQAPEGADDREAAEAAPHAAEGDAGRE